MIPTNSLPPGQKCPRSAFLPVRSARKTCRIAPYPKKHIDALLIRGSYSSAEQEKTLRELFKHFQRTLPLKIARDNILSERKFFAFLFHFKAGEDLKEQVSKIREILEEHDIFVS